MKLIKAQISKVKVIVFLIALLGTQTAATVQGTPVISTAQAQRFSRDLVQTDSQDFFRRGKEGIEREIQVLQRRHLPSSKPLLNINVVPAKKSSLAGDSQSN